MATQREAADLLAAHTRTLIEVSTAHLSKEEGALFLVGKRIPDSAGYSIIGTDEFSTFIYLSDEEDISGMSEGFTAVARLACEAGIDLIRFDRDGLPVEGCATYQW